MNVLLHISDTHFGTEKPPVVGALVALATEQRPELVVLSGDITQRARPAQFRAAKAFVGRLDAPVLAIPGNHDIALFDLWSRLSQPYARYAAVFGDELEPVHSLPDLLVIGVNTTRVWRHRHGEVSAAQVDRVARRLAAARPQQLRVVVVHQPAAVTQAGDQPHLLRGCSAATQAWSAAGADLVMGGHIHLPFTLPLQGLARRLWVVQAGTAVSSRTRPEAPNSVNLVRWGPGVTESARHGPCLVERWDCADPDQGFSRATVTPSSPSEADRPAVQAGHPRRNRGLSDPRTLSSAPDRPDARRSAPRATPRRRARQRARAPLPWARAAALSRRSMERAARMPA